MCSTNKKRDTVWCLFSFVCGAWTRTGRRVRTGRRSRAPPLRGIVAVCHSTGVGGCWGHHRAEQSPAPTSGLLLPFAIHPALAGIVTALRAAGASDGTRGTSGCRNQCPWGRRRPLRRESILACGQPACYQSVAGVGGTRRSRPTEGWQVFGGTGADRVVRPYELVGIARRGSGGAAPATHREA